MEHENKKPIGRGRLWLFWAIIIIIPLALAAIGAERVARYRFKSLPPYFRDPIVEYTKTGKLPPSYWMPHPIWHHGLNPDFPENHLNRYGFRGVDFPKEKPRGEFRVVCVGDSTTQGAGLPFDHTYPFFLERFLSIALAPRPVTVINAGIGSHTTVFNIAYLGSQLVDFSPDAVLIKSAYNDYLPFSRPGFDGDYTIAFPEIFTMPVFPDPAPVWARRSYIGKLYFARELIHAQQKFVLGMDAGATDQATVDANLKLIGVYGHRLKTLAGIASANGATPLFLDLPYSTPRVQGWFKSILDTFNKEIVKVARDGKISLVSTGGRLDESDFTDHVHNSPQGHQRIAAQAANGVLASIGSPVSLAEIPLGMKTMNSPAGFEKGHLLEDITLKEKGGYAMARSSGAPVPIFLELGQRPGQAVIFISFHNQDNTSRLSVFVKAGDGEWTPHLTLEKPRENPAMPELAAILAPAGATGAKLVFEAASGGAVSIDRITAWAVAGR